MKADVLKTGPGGPRAIWGFWDGKLLEVVRLDVEAVLVVAAAMENGEAVPNWLKLEDQLEASKLVGGRVSRFMLVVTTNAKWFLDRVNAIETSSSVPS